MYKTRMVVKAATLGFGLLFSGVSSADFASPERVEIKGAIIPAPLSTIEEQVTTHSLLRKILFEVTKANALKADSLCSDGDKRYSPGFIITTGGMKLRCIAGENAAEWVSVRP
jgi:hypothetical protein